MFVELLYSLRFYLSNVKYQVYQVYCCLLTILFSYSFLNKNKQHLQYNTIMVAFEIHWSPSLSLLQPESPKCTSNGIKSSTQSSNHHHHHHNLNNKTKYTKLNNDSPEKVVVVSTPHTLCVECDENAL